MPRHSSLLLLDPRFRSMFVQLADMLKNGTYLRPFETYRGDDAQLSAFNLGTSKARPGESPHQYGLACDFVVFKDDKWLWPDANHAVWNTLRLAATSVGLQNTINWDRPHVQVPDWKALRSESYRTELRSWERAQAAKRK